MKPYNERIDGIASNLKEEMYSLYMQGYKQGRIEALEQEPCEDAISRQAVFGQINCWIGSGEYRFTNATDYLIERVKHISSIEPQEPKVGHWMNVVDEDDGLGNMTWHHECSICEKSGWGEYKYCPNCGARMAESEDKEHDERASN